MLMKKFPILLFFCFFSFIILCSCSRNEISDETKFVSFFNTDNLTVSQWAEKENSAVLLHDVEEGYFVDKYFIEYKNKQIPDGLFFTESHILTIRTNFFIQADLWKSRSRNYWFIYVYSMGKYYLGDVVETSYDLFLWEYTWPSLKSDGRFEKILLPLAHSIIPIYFSSADVVLADCVKSECTYFCDSHAAVLSLTSNGGARLAFLGFDSNSYTKYRYKFRSYEGRTYKLCTVDGGCAVNIYDNGIFTESVMFSGNPLYPNTLTETKSDQEYRFANPVIVNKMQDGSVKADNGLDSEIIIDLSSDKYKNISASDSLFYCSSSDGSLIAIIYGYYIKVFKSDDFSEVYASGFSEMRKVSGISFINNDILYIGFDYMFGYNNNSYVVRYADIDNEQ